LNAQVLGISVDHIPCLKAWAESLGGVSYPLLSDFWPHGRVSELYGVFRSEGHSERAIFVIDRDGMICSMELYDLDDQPENQDLWRILERLEPDIRLSTPEVRPVQAEPLPQTAPLPQEGIVMYCTPWCPDCRRARSWMQERGLKWTEVNINQNPAAEAQVKTWGNGYRITPTFDVYGTIVLDFKIDQLEAALKGRIT
jgi:glutaredoxin